MDYGRNEISDFLKKAYELVDDPSTDSIISWSPNGLSFVVLKPLECSRDLLTRRLQITNFSPFQSYGFRKIDISPGQELEFACDDFVRGKPELLDKIAQRYLARLKAYHDSKYGELDKRLKSATTREEYELAIKEHREKWERESRDRKARTRVTPTIPYQDFAFGRNDIFDFLKKAYALVDDPSTDSIVSWAPNGLSFVVWQPLEFTKDLLPRHLQITHFAKFHTYGFSKLVISSGQQLEFMCNDFVRGKPELLDKIAQRYVARMKDTELWKIDERLENATSKEEYDLAMKDKEEMFARKSKERKAIMATRRKST
ncbi:unnamed protein product [Arabidopsis halleri]